jgi:hypothetical protein
MKRTYTKSTSPRIRWTDDENRQLAAKWIELRLAHPAESATDLLEQSQRKVLDGSRQRDIGSFIGNPRVVQEVGRQWKLLTMRLAAPSEPERPPQPVAALEPAVRIITLEVTRKLTFQEMLEHVDEPALEALLSAKRLIRENRYHQLLHDVISAHGGKSPVVPPLIPRMDAFAAPRTHGPRIAIIGASPGHHPILMTEIKAAGLDVSLSFPEADDSTTVSRCDYAIISRGKLANNSDGDRVIGQLGRNQVVLLDEANTTTIMQRIRDITSRKTT